MSTLGISNRMLMCRGALTVMLATVLVGGAFAQTLANPDALAELKQIRTQEILNVARGELTSQPGQYRGDVALSGNFVLVDHAGSDRGWGGPIDLYTGLQNDPNENEFWYWTINGGETAYWALDDGAMGSAGATAGGAHVTELEFSFGLHADYAGDTLYPCVFVTFYNAPYDPVAQAADPVVEPPAPVMSIVVNFNPITLPDAGFWMMTTGFLDLAAAGLDFDLDEHFYVEVVPLEWSSYPNGGPVPDPDVFAIFTGPGSITEGSNQDRMWSDLWYLQGGCDPIVNWYSGDGDGYYDHPAEMYDGGCTPYLNQTGVNLRGYPCGGLNVMRLDVNAPDDLCVKPGEPLAVTMSQTCLPGLIRGFQAFLNFDPAALTFESGDYTLNPYGLPVINPIVADGGDVNLAAGINDAAGQSPASTTADLVTLNFTAGLAEGMTQVAFRTHDPATMFTGEFGGAVVPTLIDSPWICVDGTPPDITCPPDLPLQCVWEVPPPAANLAEFIAQGGAAGDSNACGYGVVVTHAGDAITAGAGCASDPYVVLRTYRAADCAGNYTNCVQTITVIDDMQPVITNCPGNITVNNDAGLCSAVVSWAAPDAVDNCGTVDLNSDHSPGETFPVGVTTVTYTAVDPCGAESYCTFNVTVVDNENPTIVCPPNITVNADAGGCNAAVSVPAPAVGDNCAVDAIVNDYNGGPDASDVYPCGVTTVTWTVTDVHGNVNTCQHAVTVDAFNELLVDVELTPALYDPNPGVPGDVVTRCITFELWECDSPSAQIVREEIVFSVDSGLPHVGGALVLVPYGDYECITARDELHTLRRTDEDQFGLNPIVGTQYVADFTDRSAYGGDDDSLIGGNLNDDAWVDIFDFGEFSGEWGTVYAGPDVDCTVGYPNADVNASGIVDTPDFGFIQVYFQTPSDENCCGQPNLLGGEGPVLEITVAELERLGLGKLAAGDLNRDGRLDQADVAAFLNGARPEPDRRRLKLTQPREKGRLVPVRRKLP